MQPRPNPRPRWLDQGQLIGYVLAAVIGAICTVVGVILHEWFTTFIAFAVCVLGVYQANRERKQ